jgi:uncharacterized membrane protein
MKISPRLVRWLLIQGQGFFYLLAGVNHFIHPEFYVPLMPEWIPQPNLLHLLAGAFEIVFGLGLLWQKTRALSAVGLMGLLVAFIPVHLVFVLKGSCLPDGLCVPAWLGWVRLVVVHPLLMLFTMKAGLLKTSAPNLRP